MLSFSMMFKGPSENTLLHKRNQLNTLICKNSFPLSVNNYCLLMLLIKEASFIKPAFF
jgi:hypothetical protein